MHDLPVGYEQIIRAGIAALGRIEAELGARLNLNHHWSESRVALDWRDVNSLRRRLAEADADD